MKLIEFVLYPQLVALDVAGPLEVFSAATRLLQSRDRKDEGYHCIFSGFTTGPIETSSGLTLFARFHLSDCRKRNILLIPGSLDTETVISSPDSLRILAEASHSADRLVSVCTGALLLAASGLLNNRKATTHWLRTAEMASRFPAVTVDDSAIYVQDGTIYTSAGVTAGIDLALALVDEDYGSELAMEVAQILVLYRRRQGSQQQFSTPLHLQTLAGKRFSDLHQWLQKNIRNTVTVEEMAAHSAMSARNFARVFKAKTGMSPGRYLETLRLNSAREYLEAGEINLATVADLSGFLREEKLRRAFIRRLGVSPGQYRAHFSQTSTSTKG